MVTKQIRLSLLILLIRIQLGRLNMVIIWPLDAATVINTCLLAKHQNFDHIINRDIVRVVNTRTFH